jgi:hypothetical protein
MLKLFQIENSFSGEIIIVRLDLSFEFIYIFFYPGALDTMGPVGSVLKLLDSTHTPTYTHTHTHTQID